MNIEELVNIIFMKINKTSIIRYKEVKNLCYRKYKGHNKGCPNVDKCKVIPYFDDIDEIIKENYYLLIANFDYQKYQYLRGIEKPNWTINQIRCVLYWQNSVKKILRNKILNIWNFLRDVYVLGCGSGFNLHFQDNVYSMESVGINVFSTLKLNNICYDIKAINNVKLVCLLCSNQLI